MIQYTIIDYMYKRMTHKRYFDPTLIQPDNVCIQCELLLRDTCQKNKLGSCSKFLKYHMQLQHVFVSA